MSLKKKRERESERESERERERERGGEKNAIFSGHLRLYQQPRAAHALRSDQFFKKRALITLITLREGFNKKKNILFMEFSIMCRRIWKKTHFFTCYFQHVISETLYNV
jgi:hypothetical protein